MCGIPVNLEDSMIEKKRVFKPSQVNKENEMKKNIELVEEVDLGRILEPLRYCTMSVSHLRFNQ